MSSEEGMGREGDGEQCLSYAGRAIGPEAAYSFLAFQNGVFFDSIRLRSY
jgi:hypothetical protein